MQKRVGDKDYPQWKSSIGVAVRQRREQLKKSLKNTASHAQINPDLLLSIESGRGHLTLQQLYRLSCALDTPMSQLLLGTERTPTTGDVREFMEAFHQLKDPVLKDRISSLVNTMVAPLTEDVPKTEINPRNRTPASQIATSARPTIQPLIERVLIARHACATSLFV